MKLFEILGKSYLFASNDSQLQKKGLFPTITTQINRLMNREIFSIFPVESVKYIQSVTIQIIEERKKGNQVNYVLSLFLSDLMLEL